MSGGNVTGLTETQAWLVRVGFAGLLAIIGAAIIIAGDHDTGLGIITLAVGSVFGGGVVFGANQIKKAATNGDVPIPDVPAPDPAPDAGT